MKTHLHFYKHQLSYPSYAHVETLSLLYYLQIIKMELDLFPFSFHKLKLKICNSRRSVTSNVKWNVTAIEHQQ
jgi:hypothetical protein